MHFKCALSIPWASFIENVLSYNPPALSIWHEFFIGLAMSEKLCFKCIIWMLGWDSE